MNKLLIILSIFLLILQSRAQDTKFKSKETKSFAEELATIFGIFSFTSVATLISPIIVKTALIPLFLIFKLISKPLIMVGLTGYLMVALTPLILARSGMTSPVFESRSQDSGLFSSIGSLLSTNMSVITTETMNFFDLDNEECKLEMSCRLGKRIANYIPYLQYFVTQSGAANWIEEKYMANMVRSMTDSKDCENICQSINNNLKAQQTTTYSSDSSNSGNNMLEWLG